MWRTIIDQRHVMTNCWGCVTSPAHSEVTAAPSATVPLLACSRSSVRRTSFKWPPAKRCPDPMYLQQRMQYQDRCRSAQTNCIVLGAGGGCSDDWWLPSYAMEAFWISRNAPSMDMAQHNPNLKSPRQLRLQVLSTMCGTCFCFQCVSVLHVMLGPAWVWWCCTAIAKL